MNGFSEMMIISFNVVKACIGAGISRYPEMFDVYGVLPVLLMTIASGIASVFGAFAYLNLNSKFKKNQSISTLSEIIISPKFRYFVDSVVILKCVAVAAVFLNLSKETIQNIPLSTGFPLIDQNPAARGFIFNFIGCLLQLPIMVGTSLQKLKAFSYLGVFSIILLIIISFVQTNDSKRVYSVFTDNINVFRDVGTFVFGFTCHQSILNIHNDANVSDIMLYVLISFSFTFVALLYFIFGFVNYSAFSSNPDIYNVFILWEKNNLTSLGALFFASSLILSVPFQIHPAKTYFGDMFKLKTSAKLVTTCVMITIAFFLSTASWYDIKYVSRNITKPMNTLLCFGFPLLFTLLNKGKKTVFDLITCIYLGLFTSICIASFFY